MRIFTPDIFEVSLERRGYDFVPGECAVLFDESGNSRPYSIASGVEEPVLRFLLRRFSGGALSNWLADRHPGDVVQLSPPFGAFRTAESVGPVIFVATGVGISPFLSALRSNRFEPLTLHCLYGVRQVEDAVLLPLLRQRATLHLAVSRQQVTDHFHGRVTDLFRTLQLPKTGDYYLCGCDAMIDEMFDLLENHGVSSSRIYTEVFFSSDRMSA